MIYSLYIHEPLFTSVQYFFSEINSMFRPTSDLTAEPGIKYLELVGLRLIRSFFVIRLVIIIMGLGMIITSIVLSVMGLVDDFIPFEYILGGTGGMFLLIIILTIIFGPNRWYFNKIRDLRDSGATQELKKLAYRGGMKSMLAMYALVDLGEMSINTMQGYPRGYYGQ